MKVSLLTIILITLSACGKGYEDPSIRGYVDSFIVDAAARGRFLQVNTDIRYGNVLERGGNSGTIAICHTGTNGGSITIDQYKFHFLNETNQKMIIYHELGHCILGRVHKDDTIYWAPADSNLDSSIMNSYAPSEYYIKTGGDSYYNYLLDELFK